MSCAELSCAELKLSDANCLVTNYCSVTASVYAPAVSSYRPLLNNHIKLPKHVIFPNCKLRLNLERGVNAGRSIFCVYYKLQLQVQTHHAVASAAVPVPNLS